MRQQFLRVYIGIALVLVAAALVTLFLVDREMRRVVESRLEEAMEPWVWRIRQQLLRAGTDPELEAKALEELNDTLPFPLSLVSADSLALPERANARIAAGRPALVTRNDLPVLYAPFDQGRLLRLGPLDKDGGAPAPAPPWRARLPEPLPQWFLSLREHVSTAPGDTAGRRRLLEQMRERLPHPAAVIPRAQATLTDADQRRLNAGMPCMESVSGGRMMLYLAYGPDSVLAIGPIQRGPRTRRGRTAAGEPAMVRPHRPEHALPLLQPAPFQGAYLLIGVLLGLLVLIGGAVYWLLRPFEKRIYLLADVAQEFGQGQLDRRAQPVGTDAIALLAGRFNEMADRLSSLIQGQQELLRAVSHELRTPMARLFFLVDDARSKQQPEQKDAILQRVEASLQELNSLVDELLTFIRLEGQADEQDRQLVYLDELFADVGGVVTDLRPDIAVEVDGGNLQAEAVPRLLRRAVANLATNAARHAQHTVRLTAVQDSGSLWIHVDDDGPGVPPEARQRVFEPFFRLDASRTSDGGGAGLGLAIVQRIVQVHGGRVHVSASPAGGARFSVQLPETVEKRSTE